MNKNLQNIDKAFLQHLDKYKEDPPEDAWDTIENELNKKEAALYKGKYLWLKKILVCAVFIAAFLLLSNVLQPVLNKHVYKKAANFNIHHLNDSTVENNSNTSNTTPDYLLPRKISHTKRETQKNIVKATGINDSSGYFKKPHPVNDETSSNINMQSNPVYPEKENFVQVKPQYQAPVIDGNKQDQSPAGTSKKPIVKLKHKHSFYIVPYFSIDHVTGRVKTLGQADNSSLPPFEKERLDMAWTAGVLFEKEISQKVSIQTGILHSYWTNPISPAIVKALQDNSGAYKFKLTTNYGSAELEKSKIAKSGDSAVVTNGVVKLQSVSVPLTAVINLKNGRLKINALTGGSVNFITTDIAEIEYRFANNVEKDRVQKLQGLRKSYLTVVAGAEANYAINTKIRIGVNPLMRYAITPVNKSTLVKTYPISIGIGASVRVKL